MVHTTIKETLEKVSQKLVIRIFSQINILQHTDGILQYDSILIEQLLIMHIEEGKRVIIEIFQFTEIPFNRIPCLISFRCKKFKCILYFCIFYRSHLIIEELLHSSFIQIDQTVLQREIIIISRTLPKQLKFIRMITLIYDFRQEKIHQFVKGILMA